MNLILVYILFLGFYIPPVHASTISCAEENSSWDCSLDIDSEDGVIVSFTLSQPSNVVFTTYPSLTCDDHGSDEGTGAYAGDPYIYLYSGDTLLVQDDDSASHNDGTNLCWDSHIAVNNLAAGDYTLKATVWEDEFGAYSMDISGVPSLSNSPTTTTTSTTTTTATAATTTTTGHTEL